MKYYLSSYKFGNRREELKSLAPTSRILIIPNVLDFREADTQRTLNSLENKMTRLEEIGLAAEVLDLKDYSVNKIP